MCYIFTRFTIFTRLKYVFYNEFKQRNSYQILRYTSYHLIILPLNYITIPFLTNIIILVITKCGKPKQLNNFVYYKIFSYFKMVLIF